MLARALWERSEGGLKATSGGYPGNAAIPGDTLHSAPTEAGAPSAADWHSQVEEELESLRQLSPNALSDVGMSLERALTVGQAVTRPRGVTVDAMPTPPKLMATIHPSALRHVLITAIEQMAQRMRGGKITLDAILEAETIRIAIRGAPLTDNSPLHSELIDEIVATHGGTISVQRDDDALDLQITLPSSSKKIVVMVIDDNADLMAFYRRYVAGTPYESSILVTAANSLRRLRKMLRTSLCWMCCCRIRTAGSC
jgi:hypothetical protein